jgi:hypothetical protein
MRTVTAVLLAGVGGCGGGGDASVEAAFAPGFAADAVSVAESGRSERADSAGFLLDGLTPGPARIRLVLDGDTVGVLQIAALPAGARLVLHGLRADPATGLAFPRSIELRGADLVTVNGVRMAPEGRVPRRVDLDATVLGVAVAAGAVLLRPGDAGLPDLRVALLPASEVVHPDGATADLATLAAGDSVRITGRREGAYVVAERLVLPARLASASDEPAEAVARESARPAVPVAARPAAASDPPSRPAARPERERGRPDNPGRGRGKAKGRERG